MKKKNSRKQFATKHTKAVRAGVLALLEQTNVYQLPERRVALSTAITVANRDLRKTRNSDPETRVFSALRAVSGYLSLAANNRVTTAALQNADLLPVGHPSSRARHAMAASALRHARALWVAADPMIDDSMRSLVASAHSAEPGSIERKHAFTRISVAPAGLVPLTAAVDVTPLLAVGLGGNSDFARSARARLQRRDRYGKFAFMGGGFSFNLRGSDGSTSVVSGRVVGGSGTDGVELEIAGSDSLPDGIYTISSSKGTAARAILSEEDVKDLPSREKQDLIGDSVFVSQGDVMSTRKDAPSGWNAQGAESNGVSAYKSDDGYDVTKTTDPATKTASYELSRELDNAPVGEGTFDSWADVQKAALADQDAYKKDLQASEAGDRKVIAPARPRSSDDGYDAIVDQMLEEGWSKTGGDPALGYDRTDTTENHWNAELRRRAMQRDAQRGEYDEWSYTPPDPKKSVGTLGENEKNKVFIDWARQQDSDFYKSVVAQYDKRVGKLTQKQWDALENGFMKDKSSSSFDGTPKDMTPEEKAELIDWVVSGQYLPTTKELQTDGFGVAHNDSSARENRNSLRERMFKALDEGTYVPTETWDRLRALKADEKDKSWDVDQLLVKDSPMRDPDQSAEQTIANTLAMGWRALDNVAPEKPGNEYYVSKAEAQLRDATALLDFIDASDDQRLAASNLRDSIARVKDIEPEPDETSTFSAEIDKFIEANNFKELPEFAEDAIYKLISERNSLAEEDVDRYKEFLDLLDALLSDSGMYLDNGMIYDDSEVTEKQKEQVSRSTMYQRSREFFNNNPELFKPFKQVLAEDIALENEEFGAITLQGLDNAIPSAEDVAKLTEAFDLTLDDDPDEPPTGGLPTAPEPDEPTPGAPDFVSPEVGLDLLSDALSGVESSLRDIPDEDLDNLDEEDSDAITKVGDLLDSAQDAIDSIDPVGSDTNDLHFEQARADLGEAAQILSESNNGDMQNAGFDLKEKVDEFVNLPQIDFSGSRAERAKAEATPAVSEPEDIDTDADRFFSETMFDSMFEAPDGAYKVDVAGMYEPQGRTDEDSADFTDDPMVLSQKFDKQELTVALANATVAFDGGDASGYGDLPFDGGDEPVKAEAIYAALEVLEGPDEAERILASIYDAGLGAESTANIDMYEQRRRDAAVVTPGESTADVIPVTSADDDFLANVDANGVLGIPSRTQLTVELMRDHVETNPKISEVADYLKQLQDERSFEDGAFLEPTLDKYLPWAFSDDPEEKSAFNGIWGMMMSLDGGSSLENETDRTGFRKTLFEALRRQSGASSDTEAIDVYQDFVSEYGGFSDFVSGKSAIADGTVGLEDGTVAGDFFRLMKSSSRPNTQELYRVINVSGSNEQLLAQYTTEGNIVGLDPRSFSENDSTGGSAIDSMTWASSNKTDHRLVFVAAPGEVDSIDTIPVSWFSGENEHLAYGQVEIASVRRQASGLPGRADEFIIEIRRTDTTPEDLVESLNPAPAQDGVSLETFDVSDWKQTGAQAGTNEGGFFEDADGNGYYVKVPKTKSHAENEVLASVLYEELGVPSAQVRMGDLDGEDRIVSKLIPGANPDFADKVAEGDEEYLNKIREDFAIDAWLSNYDVTGTEWENVVTDENGDPVRVDPGGALMWRARGAEKGGMFGNEVAEIDGLRDPDLNYYGSSVFGSMTDADVKESAKKLLNITPSRIDSIIDSVITSEDDRALLKERLKARRDNILKRFNLSEKDSDVLGNPVPLTNSIGFEAQDLAPGDITASDSFVIENVFRDESTPKGKISVQGYYPGHESQRKEWNETTVIDAARGSTVPPKGDAPAIHRPKKPYAPTPPAFQGEIADAIANAQSWEEVRSILAGRDIVFFDYETTGFGTGSGNNPVQLGAVKMRDGQVVDRFNLFMDPMEDLSDWSRENLKDVDGNPLTDEFLSQQSGMGEAHALFAEWAGADAILTAHNTPFDREVLERINAAENVDFTPAGYIDTLKLSRALLNRKTNRDPDGPEGHKLPQLMEHYGLEFAGWHTADADAEATANLFNAMLDDAAGRPDGEASLGVVKDQPSEFEKQIADHQAAVKEYQDALADYNAQIAVAAAWNCGGAGITAAVGEGNGPCSVPSVDELIDASTVKPGQLSDPEAITSGDPELDNDLTGDAVENAAFDGVDTRLPTGVDELPSEDVRQSNISDSFDEVVAQAEAILDPESFKLKKSVSTALEQARDDVAEIRKDLEAGNITEEQAIARLNDVIDSVPEPKGDTPLDVEMGVFRDTIIDLRSTLDNTAYRRPGGPDVPPIETHASRGYSKDGKFLVPGTRVRDKWGYLGTVQRYNKAGWVNVYVTRDIDGKIQSKGTQHLTTVNDEDDQSPWVFDPKIPEGKRPENWQELIPEAATSPKAEAPEGASEAPEVDNSSEITPAGRPRPAIEKPKSISESSLKGTNSLMGAIEKIKDRNKNKRVYESAPVDGSDIEDFEVRVSTVVIGGERKLRLKFKLTAWAGAEQVRRVDSNPVIDPETRSSWESINYVAIKKSNTLENGDVEIMNRDHLTFGEENGRPDARTLTATAQLNSGEVKISHLRATTEDELDAVSDETDDETPNAFHNMVTIDLPIDATEEDVKRALEIAGVKEVRATEPADVLVLAENRLLSVFGQQTDATVNEENQSRREKALADIERDWGITPSDVEIATDSSGFITYKLPEEAADRIAKRTEATVLRHRINVDSLASSHNPFGSYSALTEEERLDARAAGLVSLITGEGLKATVHRYTEGGSNQQGMSSLDDIYTGGANYVFTNPSGQSFFGFTFSDSDATIYYDPRKAYQRIDFYANEEDEYGKRFTGANVVENATVGEYGSTGAEVMFKNGLSTESSIGVVVSGSVRERMLEMLRERGVDEIAGVPIDKYVLEYLDLDEQQSGKTSVQQMLNQWIDSRNNLYNVYNPSDAFSYFNEIAGDLLVNPVQNIEEPTQLIAYDSKMRAIIRRISDGKFFRVDMINSDSDLAGEPVEIEEEQAFEIVKEIISTNTRLQNALGESSTGFLKSFGDEGIGEYLPAGQALKTNILLLESQLTVATSELQNQNSSDVTDLRMAKFLISALLTSAADDRFDERNIGKKVAEILKNYPNVAGALRDYISSLR